MPRRKRTNAVSGSRSSRSNTPLRKALLGRTKAELVDALLELAGSDRRILRQLSARFDVSATTVQLVAATRQAILDATAFDPRDMLQNFRFDEAAYAEVKRNLRKLIDSGQWRPAMKPSLELMKRGSLQVEMSGEGFMTDDIEGCLSEVLEPLRTSALPAPEVIAWCSAMLRSDRVQFIATEQLESLRDHCRASASAKSRDSDAG